MPRFSFHELHLRGDMVATQNEGTNPPRSEGNHIIDLYEETGAGEGIRTLDPNLGKKTARLSPSAPGLD
jgi:hypothetical protein